MSAANSKPAPAVFRPFEWAAVHNGDVVPPHAATALAMESKDVVEGVAELLAIFEREEIDKGCADEFGNNLPPLLSVQTRGNLTRLAIVSLRLLSDRIDDAYAGATPADLNEAGT